MQTATSETESKSLDQSICVHHYTLRAPYRPGNCPHSGWTIELLEATTAVLETASYCTVHSEGKKNGGGPVATKCTPPPHEGDRDGGAAAPARRERPHAAATAASITAARSRRTRMGRRPARRIGVLP